MGEASGAGVIFGNTGGVMEDIREATVAIGDLQVKVAVIYGTKSATTFINKWKQEQTPYHFVEVMTCPGGCISGGGQPKGTLFKGDELRKKRIAGLYKKDSAMTLRNSHDNEELKTLYSEFYQKPLSELAEKMLHTCYFNRKSELGSE